MRQGQRSALRDTMSTFSGMSLFGKMLDRPFSAAINDTPMQKYLVGPTIRYTMIKTTRRTVYCLDGLRGLYYCLAVVACSQHAAEHLD